MSLERAAPRGRDAPAGQRGQAMVEVAVVLPLLLLAALGLVQFALFYHAQDVVTAAAQEGARVASSADRTVADGVLQARALLHAGLGPAGDGIAVEGMDLGDGVVIAVRGHWPATIPWVANAGLPLQAQAAMAKEVFRAGPLR